MLAILLMLIQIEFLSDSAMDVIKYAFNHSFKQKERVSRKPWMRKLVKSNYERLCQVFLQVANTCEFTWDQVIEGLIKICFHFMDNSTAGLLGKRSCLDIGGLDDDEGSAVFAMRNLAVRALTSLFKRQEIVQSTIVEHTINRVVSLGDGATPALLLWTEIVQVCPDGICENIKIVKDCLDFLCLMGPAKAEMFLGPLCEVIVSSSTDCLNSLVLVLKKGLFNRFVFSLIVCR
jgi:hypothetical protein